MTHHKIFNVQTGEETIIPFTDEEMAAYEIALKEQENIKTATATATATRAAALAKLAKLGLTVEDLSALGLGGN